MDVTEQINLIHLKYGSSDSTDPKGLAASKKLNYAQGATIQKPLEEKVTVIPFTFRYEDVVGLFGVENVFIRMTVNATDYGNQEVSEVGWLPVRRTEGGDDDPYYTQAVEDVYDDLITVNTYEPAQFNNDLSDIWDPYISVSLDNLKTGNKYIDAWFDVRLYTRTREMHPFNEMFIRKNDVFYIGFHARNTKRLPYNVKCTIGELFVSSLDIKGQARQLIAQPDS